MSEHDPLVEQATPSTSQKPPSLLCVRFSLIVLLALLSAASIFFFGSINALKATVESDHATINKLQQEIANQGKVVARFNDTVTNEDVQKQLIALQASLSQTEARLNNQLETTETSIAKLLNDTVIRLDHTVQ